MKYLIIVLLPLFLIPVALSDNPFSKENLDREVGISWLLVDGASGFVVLLVGLVLKFPGHIVFIISVAKLSRMMLEYKRKNG